MIIWSGYGFLVPVIAFACLFTSEVGVEAWFSDEQYYQAHGWPKLIALLLAALILWPVSAMLDRHRVRNTFFFIPMRWWPLLCLPLGAAFCLLGTDSSVHAGG